MNIALMEKESELMKVQAGSIDLKIRISKLNSEIDRIKGALDIQLEKESSLKEEIKKLKE